LRIVPRQDSVPGARPMQPAALRWKLLGTDRTAARIGGIRSDRLGLRYNMLITKDFSAQFLWHTSCLLPTNAANSCPVECSKRPGPSPARLARSACSTTSALASTSATSSASSGTADAAKPRKHEGRSRVSEVLRCLMHSRPYRAERCRSRHRATRPQRNGNGDAPYDQERGQDRGYRQEGIFDA
jgi:hypothetical protein